MFSLNCLNRWVRGMLRGWGCPGKEMEKFRGRLGGSAWTKGGSGWNQEEFPPGKGGQGLAGAARGGLEASRKFLDQSQLGFRTSFLWDSMLVQQHL